MLAATERGAPERLDEVANVLGRAGAVVSLAATVHRRHRQNLLADTPAQGETVAVEAYQQRTPVILADRQALPWIQAEGHQTLLELAPPGNRGQYGSLP